MIPVVPDDVVAGRPRLAVVVLSARRGLRLRWLLDALDGQTVGRDRFEVITDGRPPDADHVAFITESSRPDPRWLEELLAAARAAPGRVVRGRTLPDPLEHGRPRLSGRGNVLCPRELVGRTDGAPAVSAPAAFVYEGRSERRLLRAPAAGEIRPVPARMRVALLHPWFWPEVRRGSERLLHDLAVDLVALGHTPRLITSHPGRTARAVEDGFEVVRCHRSSGAVLGRLGVQEAATHLPCTLSELRRGEDDAAVAAYLTDAAAAAVWSHRTGRPFVYAYMGIPDRSVLTARRGRVRMLEAVTGRAHAVVALSAAARDALWRWLGVEARIIAPGVDLEHFTPGGTRSEHPTIACAGDPGDPRKRVDALVAAFAAVRREHPTARLRLMKPRDPAVERRLAAPGVEFADLASHEVRELYRNAWVSGIASRAEAFGLVLVESLACETPVFGRREGGVPDIVDRPEVGRLFDADEDLAGVLLETLELARDPATAAACRRRAEAFSSRACALAYEELLRSLA